MVMTYLILSLLTYSCPSRPEHVPARSQHYPFSMKNFMYAITCCVLYGSFFGMLMSSIQQARILLDLGLYCSPESFSRFSTTKLF